MHERLKTGLAALGLEIVSQAGHQLWQLNAVGVPAGVDEAALRRRLLHEYSIEVGAGLRPLKGKIVRIGLMGETARPEKVDRVPSALGSLMVR